jgi:outer membrane protein, adhesin transport system
MSRLLISTLALCLAAAPTGAMTLREAVEEAANAHPAVLAAQANKRATAYELLQAQGRKLPRVDLDADVGAEKIDRPEGLSPEVNDTWRARRQVTGTLSQPIFDGWDRINDIYRNAARVDAASYRVLARAEVLALEAVEAYVNVIRAEETLVLAEGHVRSNKKLLGRVREQVDAGKIPASEIEQVQERIAASEVTVERVRQTLREGEVAFQRVVGKRPDRLQPVGFPAGIPMSRQQAVATGLEINPQLGAAAADTSTVRYTYEQTKSTDYPFVGLEMRGQKGYDVNGTPGPNNEFAAKIVLRWNVFDGMITRNRQLEFADRWSQAQADEEDRRRTVSAEIERALVAYQGAKPRLDALRRQSASATKVVANYDVEYSVGKRTLLELLNAENARFTVATEIVSTEAVHLFSAYRVLGAMGSLIASVKADLPAESHSHALSRVKRLGRLGNALQPLKRFDFDRTWPARIFR